MTVLDVASDYAAMLTTSASRRERAEHATQLIVTADNRALGSGAAA